MGQSNDNTLQSLAAYFTRAADAAGTEMLADVSELSRALLRGKRDAYWHAAEMISERAPKWDREQDPASRTPVRMTSEEVDALDAAVNPNHPAYVPAHRRNRVSTDDVTEVDAELSLPDQGDAVMALMEAKRPVERATTSERTPVDTWSDAMNEDDDERAERARWDAWAADCQHPRGDQ